MIIGLSTEGTQDSHKLSTQEGATSTNRTAYEITVNGVRLSEVQKRGKQQSTSRLKSTKVSTQKKRKTLSLNNQEGQMWKYVSQKTDTLIPPEIEVADPILVLEIDRTGGDENIVST